MGNTETNETATNALEDHPHIHGEYKVHQHVVYLRSGSPPHTWGIQYGQYFIWYQSRITPTYMGNTIDTDSTRRCIQDHPHIHGEYKMLTTCIKLSRGSPPHTWGILTNGMRSLEAIRITPTYMGNTNGDVILSKRDQDHPHIHGEYQVSAQFIKNRQGSPPHTWGILTPESRPRADMRITPTYMGNTTEHYAKERRS